MHSENSVDLIIPVLNAVAFFKKCIAALQENTQANYILYIADDGSKEMALLDYEGELAAQGAKLRQNCQRMGFGANCNDAAAQGSSAFICFLNSDTLPQYGWLSAMLDEMANDPKTGIVGSRLLYPMARWDCTQGSVQHAGVARNREGLPYHIFRGDPPESPHVMVRREINAVTAACMLVRRALFESLGGFDPRYHMGQFEDIDLCWQARAKGWKVVYRPDSLLYHYEHGSGEKYANLTSDRNRDQLMRKWGNLGSDEQLFQ